MSQNATIKLSNDYIQIVPGESSEIAVTVTNLGQSVERYEIRLADLDPGWYQLDWAEMSLRPDAPGNEATVYLRLNIPPGTPVGSYAPTVELFSDSAQDVVARAPFAINLNEIQTTGSVNLNLAPARLRTSTKFGRFQLQFSNGQGRPTSLRLNARGLNATPTEYRLVPNSLEVPAFGQAVSVVEVHPLKNNWLGPDQSHEFKVTVENLGLETNGQLLQSARLGWLRTLLTTPWLLALCILLPLLTSGVLAWLLFFNQSNQTAGTAQAATNRNNPNAHYCLVSDSNGQASIVMDNRYSTIILTSSDGSKRSPVASEDVNRLPGLFSSLVAVSPDGKQVAYVTAGDESMRNATISVATVGGFNRKFSLTTIEQGFWPSRLVWSKDGTQLAYVKKGTTNQLELWTISLADKKNTQLKNGTRLTTDAFYGDQKGGPVCWSADGSQVLVSSNNDTSQDEINLQNNSLVVYPKPSQASRPTAQFQESNATYAMAGTDYSKVQEPPLQPAGDGDCFVKTFSINDPQWSDDSIRSSDGRSQSKISTNGCPIAAAAMVLNRYGVQTDPKVLNNCLNIRAIPFDWRTLLDTTCSNGKVTNSERNEFSWAGLAEIMDKGQPAIVGLLGGQDNVHFVVVVSGADNIASTYRVNDPWDGTNYKSLAYFISQGYQPRWLVKLDTADTLGCSSRRTTMTKSLPTFNVHGNLPEDGKMYQGAINVNFVVDGGVSPKATLYTLVNPAESVNLSSDQTTTADQIQGVKVANGDSVTTEGFYELVVEATGTDGTTNRLITHFTIDKTPPTVQAAKISAVDGTQTDGFTAVKGPFDLSFTSSDRLSRVAQVYYRVNDGQFLPWLDDVSTLPVRLENGDFTIYYYAEDGAHNISALPTQPLKLRVQRPDLVTPSATTAAATTAAVDTNTTTQAVVAQTTKAAGSGSGSGSGSGQGGSGATQTTAAAGSGTGTTTVTGTLTASPTSITFEATQDQVILTLVNAGASPIVWQMQPATGAGSSLLKLTTTAGTVPATGSAQVTIQLGTFNYTSAAVTANLNIFYNNNTSSLVIPVTINPQPTPKVTFTSPATGPLSGKSVQVIAQVTPQGAAKPDHVTFSGLYIDQVGGSVVSHTLTGAVTNSGTNWTTTWDISALPPQTTMELDATVCWTADATSCTFIQPGLTGLSIPNPTATYTLTPNNNALLGTVTIAATVSGTFDHITYQYVYVNNGTTSPTQTLSSKAVTGAMSVTWDTGLIPPNSTVKLTALLCLTSSDTANCIPSTFSNNFTIASPTVTINALATADAANLPLSLSLNGTVSSLNAPSTNSQAAVFVNVTFTKNGTTTTDSSVQISSASISGLSNGVGTWAISGISTANWKIGSTVTFTPQLCWDGNKSGSYCVTGTATTATIPDLVSTLQASATDASVPITLTSSITSTRASSVTTNLYVTYKTFAGATKTTSLTMSGTGTSATYLFDSVALGLIPQTVSLQSKACSSSSSSDCGPLSNTVSLTIPDTTLDLGTVPISPLSSPVFVTPTVRSRGVTTLALVANYLSFSTSGQTATQQTLQTSPALAKDQSYGFQWNISDQIAPQTGISLTYQPCWGASGGLDQHCEIRSGYTGLSIDPPSVTTLSINGSLPYTSTSAAPLVIPVYSTTLSLNLPVTVTVTANKNTTNVGWLLETTTNGNTITTTLGSLASVNNNVAVTTIPLSIASIDPNSSYDLVAYPVWNRNTALKYYADSNTKRIYLKLASATLSLQTQKNKTVQFLPTTTTLTDTDHLMIYTTTNISLNLSDNGAAKQLRFFRGPTGNTNQVAITATQTANTAGNSSTYQTSWDHTLDPPLFGNPQGNRSNLEVSWQVCSTAAPDNSGCLPFSLTGTGTGFASKVDTLYLTGLEFDTATQNNVTDADSSGTTDASDYFNSSFQATVNLLPTGGLVKQVRFFISPVAANGSTANSMIMLSSLKQITATTDTQWNGFITWPDLIYNTPANFQNFANAVVANQGAVKITAQYCVSSDPNVSITDATCSDWNSANLGALYNSGTHILEIDGRQAIVAAWLPYTQNSGILSTTPPTDLNYSYPISSWVQAVTNSSNPNNSSVATRTVNLEVVPLDLVATGSKTITTSNVNNASVNLTYFRVNNGVCVNPNKASGGLITGTVSTRSTANSSSYFSLDWIVKNISPVLSTDSSSTWQTCLAASVSYSITLGTNNTISIKSGVSTLAHGMQTGYNPSTANIGAANPVGGSTSASASPASTGQTPPDPTPGSGPLTPPPSPTNPPGPTTPPGTSLLPDTPTATPAGATATPVRRQPAPTVPPRPVATPTPGAN